MKTGVDSGNISSPFLMFPPLWRHPISISLHSPTRSSRVYPIDTLKRTFHFSLFLYISLPVGVLLWSPLRGPLGWSSFIRALPLKPFLLRLCSSDKFSNSHTSLIWLKCEPNYPMLILLVSSYFSPTFCLCSCLTLKFFEKMKRRFSLSQLKDWNIRVISRITLISW